MAEEEREKILEEIEKHMKVGKTVFVATRKKLSELATYKLKK